jgi:hypothetical protein
MPTNLPPTTIAQLYTDRLIDLLAEPGVAPERLDEEAQLTYLWLELARRVSPA